MVAPAGGGKGEGLCVVQGGVVERRGIDIVIQETVYFEKACHYDKLAFEGRVAKAEVFKIGIAEVVEPGDELAGAHAVVGGLPVLVEAESRTVFQVGDQEQSISRVGIPEEGYVGLQGQIVYREGALVATVGKFACNIRVAKTVRQGVGDTVLRDFFFDLLHAGGQGVFFKNGSRFDTGIAKNIETVQVGHEIQRLGREELESSPGTVPADAVGVQGCFRCCRPLESFKDLFIGRHGLLQARTDFLRAEWLDVGAKAALLVLGFVNRSGYRCLACSAQEGEKAQNEALFATAHVCHDSFRPKGAE